MEREQIQSGASQLAAASYTKLLVILMAFVPVLLVVYIDSVATTAQIFVAHTFHLVTVLFAVTISLFICYITWRCYVATGEVLLKWLAYGFLGFTVVYLPHGLLTFHEAENVWLFVLFGPASRLVMAFCFLIAMLKFGEMVKPDKVAGRGFWLALLIFIMVDFLVFWAASTKHPSINQWRIVTEYISISLFVGSVLWMLIQRIRGYMPLLYSIAMIWFALSCLSFTIGKVWDHQWWLAHVIFAAGFLLLSYGVVQSFLTTGSFKTIYSQTELFKQIIEEQKRSEQMLIQLQRANEKLEELAATDPLTGIANRREFLHRAEEEASRASRNHQHLSLLAIDIDHFKSINDEYGHQVGDTVLREFVSRTSSVMRPSDLIGRIGGEEFALLLPETSLSQAYKIAERLRQYVEEQSIEVKKGSLKLTISIGVSQYRNGNDSVKKLLYRADQLLYKAKENGRNRVEVESINEES